MNLRAWLAEALGTFVLVGMGSLSLVSAGVVGQGSSAFILLIAPFGFGLGLIAAITLFGHVSGGHFNPAVTLAALFDGRIDPVNAIAYAIAQVVGAIAASMAILLVMSREMVDVTRNIPNVGDAQAFGVEVILTTMFVAVILTVTKKQPAMAGLIIGLTLVAIHFAAIPISGASVNPARALGPAIVAGKYDRIWIYLAAPLLGGILGWAMYRFFTPDTDDAEDDFDDEDDFEAEIDDLPAR